MNEITITMTMQQAVPVMMAIASQMDNQRNVRMAMRDENEVRLNIINSDNQRLAEVYKAIQDAM